MSTSSSQHEASSSLCGPKTEQHPLLERSDAAFDDLPDLAQPLIVKDRAFHRQFASLYFFRLHKLRAVVLREAQRRWETLPGSPQYVPKVLEVTPRKCYIIGTIYLEMALKPNVLDDLAKDKSLAIPAMPAKYRTDSNKITIEDESGRIVLTGNGLKNEKIWVTGMVVALLGKETEDGLFDVEEVCYPDVPEQPVRSPGEDKYIALLSGLNFGSSASYDLKAQLLTEFLSGELGGPEDQRICSNICRVIIAGNSIGELQISEDLSGSKKYGNDSAQYDSEPLVQLDELLEELCGSVPVDVMAGENDPVNRQMPQQPLQRSLFPHACTMNNFRTVTNPYWCKIDDVTLLGTSGQNIDDLFKYVDVDSPLEIAEKCLFWRHAAPSAPDTLWCYPFQDRDPFILETCPHVYFIGNQEKFENSVVEGPDGQRVRVVLVPSFAKTGSIILLNMRNLECTELCVLDPQAMNEADSKVHYMDTSE
ncbi:DNA polymerase alpha/epsilon subunit B-domain-containing protein [Dichotomocladium elegans]|nr:DNA polymerase alpha/epsilon subunit B-domain-containing protein [Dichotomocladium elegans]